MQEEETLADSPQRRGPKHVALRQALRDVVGESAAHVMDEQVGEKMRLLILERRGFMLRPSDHHGRVAEGTADAGVVRIGSEQLLATLGAG